MAGVHSALAPASTSTAGVRPRRGSGVAMQGRTTPGSRPMRSNADAMVAPVLPADTMAEALPSRTSSATRTREESFFRRTPPAGSSSMPMTSVQGTNSRPKVSPTRSGGPTSTMPTPCSSEARRAPSTISPGARSPPMASTATGSVASVSGLGRSPRRLKSVDLDRLAAPVPAAAGADHVGSLGRLAVRAHAAGGQVQTPRPSQMAAALGLGLLLLGDGHGGTPTIDSGAGALSDGAGPGATGYRSTSRLAPRGSRGATQPHSPSLRFAPQWTHKPAQSSRHSGAMGSSRTTASRASSPRSTVSSTIG